MTKEIIEPQRSFVENYFHRVIEYPVGIAAAILPIGVLYRYISVSFLDGLIGHVTPAKAFVLGRYRQWDSSYRMGPLALENGMTVEPSTKEEAFRLLTSSDCSYLDTKLRFFDDDVLILARISPHSSYKLHPDERIMYYYFHYDPDVSNCSIGRFLTDKPDEDVKASFALHVENYPDNSFGAREIPIRTKCGEFSW